MLHYKNPFQRLEELTPTQITEAIEINDTEERHRMNSRAEWHLPKVPRISIGTM